MRWIENLILWGLEMLPVRLSDNQKETIVQFIKFGVVGISNTCVSYGVNIMTIMFLKPFAFSFDYVIGNVTGFLLSVLWAFYWNEKLVFKVSEGMQRNMGKALLKTYVSYSFTGLFLCNVLSYLWIDVLGISKYVSPVINVFISYPINFFINRVWAFRTEKTIHGKEDPYVL